MATGLCFAELGAAIPAAGGSYAYLRTAFGPVTGRAHRRVAGLARLTASATAFILIWSMYFVQKAGSQAIISIVFARYLGGALFGWDIHSPDLDDQWSLKLLAIATIVRSSASYFPSDLFFFCSYPALSDVGRTFFFPPSPLFHPSLSSF